MLAARLRIGDWILDPNTHQLTKGIESHRLNPKELEVLSHLAAAAPGLVTSQALLSRSWPNVVVGDHVLHEVISRLRKMLGDSARQPAYIETLARRGYRMVAPVAIDTLHQHLPDRSIMVVPITVGKEAELETLAAGLEEDLRRELTGYREIRTITALPSTGRTSHDNPDAAYTLHGDLRWQPDGLRLRVNLIRSCDGESVWSHTCGLPSGDADFDPIPHARTVGRFVRLQLVRDHQGITVTEKARSGEAAQAVCAALEENYRANQGGSPDASLVLSYSKRAVSLDPNLIEGHWIEAMAYHWQFIYQELPWQEAARSAHRALDRAMEIDRGDPMVYWLRGVVESGVDLDYASAVDNHRRAIELDPLHPNARWFHAGLGEVALRQGKVDEALSHYRRALRLYDSDGRIWYQYSGVLYVAGDFREAVRAANAGLDLISSGMYRFLLLVFRFRAYLRLGDVERAKATKDELSASGRDWGVTPAILANLGMLDEARKMMRELEAAATTHPDVIVFGHAALGDGAEAFKWLHRAIDIRAETTLKYLRTHPDFDDLRRDQQWIGVIEHLEGEETRGRILNQARKRARC